MQSDLRSDESKPTVLYKYRSWSTAAHQSIIKANQIYFARLEDLNDPLEGDIPLRYEKHTDSEFKDYIKDAQSRNAKQLNREQRREEMRAMRRARKRHRKAMDSLGHSGRKWLLNELHGICSLSALRDNVKMWSLYAEDHCGFCVGFKTKELTRLAKTHTVAPEKVNYVVDYPDIVPPPKVDIDIVRLPLLTKSARWKDEEEYRLIMTTTEGSLTSEERLKTLPDEAICEVILGCRIPDSWREEILFVVATKDPQPELYQAQIKEGTFDLCITRIEV